MLHNVHIRNHKKRGEWAELMFMATAAARGLNFSKPWGESGRYDVAIEHDGHFLRVQVKSVQYKVGPSYKCGLRGCSRKHPYRRREVDLFAIYIIPEDLWYILPASIALVTANRNVCLTPNLKGHRYEPYKEAWQLLRPRKKVAPRNIRSREPWEPECSPARTRVNEFAARRRSRPPHARNRP